MNTSQLGLVIDLNTLEIHKGGVPIQLTPKERDLLRVLIEHKNQPLSYEFLLQAVWGGVYGIENNYLYSYMAQLRKKLSVRASLRDISRRCEARLQMG